MAASRSEKYPKVQLLTVAGLLAGKRLPSGAPWFSR